MQRIEVIQEVDGVVPTPEHYLEYEQADESDFITDEDEIRAIIRRAVTISWEDNIFTLDELHGHLIKNFVKLPVPEDREYEWLENTVYEMWRAQKEMARVAGVTVPTIINTEIEGKRHYGIMKPTINGNEEYTELLVNVIEEQHEPVDEPTQLVVLETPCEDNESIENEVIEKPDIAPSPLRPSEIAVRLFDEYITSNEVSPKFDISYLMNLFKNKESAVQPKNVRDVIKTMAECGYIRSYTTGKNKNQRTWWCMDADIKADVQADIHDGSLREYLPDMFDGQEAVA